MINIEKLTKIFKDGASPVVALEDVSLDINDGDIFGIIGMSGAGKSTLLRCLSMLEVPTSGRILLDGTDTTALKGAKLIQARRKMGVVFQGYNLLMQKTVSENVAFPLDLAKMPKEQKEERVKELLELVGLADKSSAYPSQLSGGQKQRVAIARALATAPEVLLCDEPTSALDSLTTKSVLQLLQRINHDMGVTIIIITHEMSVVKAICNRVAVIDASHFVEAGDTHTVFDKPQSAITRMLLGKEEEL
ncbi:MAG: ATP-binding cassette domain-containing protein [Oscillospiraceae bacterium]